MIKIIGFIGNAGAGKTTAAKYLMDNGYIRLRFADGLKRMLKNGLGIDEEYIDGDKKHEPCEELCGRTSRHAMITLGTEWGRELIHPDIWVTTLNKQLVRYITNGRDRFVIDDFRFINEVDWLHNLYIKEGCLIKIVREGVDVINHQSETEQKGIEADWTIYNNGYRESMYKSIDNILEMAFDKEDPIDSRSMIDSHGF